MLVSDGGDGRRLGLKVRWISGEGVKGLLEARAGYDSYMACARSCINGVCACWREAGSKPRSEGT